MREIKGVILAAGLGSRLRPLTDTVPKPLLPFCGVPIFYLAISRLLQAGIKEIAANAHYLPEQIADASENNPFGIRIYVSFEKERILGTGGVYGNLNRWRQGAALLAINGDTVSDFDLSLLTASHAKNNPWVTLGLVKGANPLGNSVWIDQSNKVVSISVSKPLCEKELLPYTFSGFQVLSDEILKEFRQDTPADLIEAFRNGLRAGKIINGIYQECFWHDLGTPSSYFLAHKEFLDTKTLDLSASENDGFGYRHAAQKMDLKLQYFQTPLVTSNHTVMSPSVFVGNISVGQGSRIGPYLVASGNLKIEARSEIKASIILGNSYPVHEDPLEHVIIHKGLITEF